MCIENEWSVEHFGAFRSRMLIDPARRVERCHAVVIGATVSVGNIEAFIEAT
jgi:hypothetical protein